MCQVLYCWNHVFAQSQTYHKAKKVFWPISQSRWYNKQTNKLALYHWHILYRSKVKGEPIGYLSYSRAKPTNIRARSTSQVVTRKRDVCTAVSFSKTGTFKSLQTIFGWTEMRGWFQGLPLCIWLIVASLSIKLWVLQSQML